MSIWKFHLECDHGKLTKRQGSSDTFYSSNEPLLEFLLHACRLTIGTLFVFFGGDYCGLGPREEVDQIHNTVLMNVSGLQNA